MSFLFTIGWIIMGGLAAYYAKQRGRNPYLWFFIGLLFGIFGLLLLFIFPKRAEKTAPKPVFNTPPPESDKPIIYWYYVDDNHTQQGPLSETAFLDAKEAGKIIPSSYVWNESMDNWKRLSEI